MNKKGFARLSTKQLHELYEAAGEKWAERIGPCNLCNKYANCPRCPGSQHKTHVCSYWCRTKSKRRFLTRVMKECEKQKAFWK